MPRLVTHPATATRWDDLAALFGPRGACAGCWCMWPRLPAAEFTAGKGDRNRRALRRLVDEQPPGLLGYVGDEAVLERGRRLDARAWLLIRGWVKPVVKVQLLDAADPAPYWLVSCRRPEALVTAVRVGRTAGRSG